VLDQLQGAEEEMRLNAKQRKDSVVEPQLRRWSPGMDRPAVSIAFEASSGSPPGARP
jgi:hypothetical protein